MNFKIDLQHLDSWIRVLLYVLVFWLPYSTAVVESMVILAMLLWIFKRSLIAKQSWNTSLEFPQNVFIAMQSFKLNASVLAFPIILFLLVGLLSILGSAWPEKSIHGFLTKTLEWFIVFFLFVEVFKTKEQIRFALWILLFTSVATSLDAILQYFTGRDIFFGHLIELRTRVTAGFNASNALGAFLIFPFFILLSKLWSQKKNKAFILLILGLVIVGVAEFLTFSRGGLLAFLAGIIFFVFASVKKNSLCCLRSQGRPQYL